MTAIRSVDMADMPVQVPEAPASAAAARARFFNSGNAFNIKLPQVPATAFRQEVGTARAMLAGDASGFVDCDQSSIIGGTASATTPLMVARYVALAAADRLALCPRASGAIWYVIDGAGEMDVDGEHLAFGTGDVMLTPGGGETSLVGGPQGALLWLVTDEPLYAFAGATPDRQTSKVVPVHYPADEISRQLQRVVDAAQNATTSGIALIFSSETLEAGRNILPTLTLSLNTVPPGEHQRGHEHNSAAITLILKGSGAYSMVGDERYDWSDHATLVTPATLPHSHHNPSAERAMFLIVQDGGLHYRARTMGFRFLEPAGPTS
ncbi:MAG: probabe gentisate 1,2-dioxygenase [Proteobacteria bacterium]|nr:probabe gentisate 1,2-dioxygenase [Pseudomonadota bacterium]